MDKVQQEMANVVLGLVVITAPLWGILWLLGKLAGEVHGRIQCRRGRHDWVACMHRLRLDGVLKLECRRCGATQVTGSL